MNNKVQYSWSEFDEDVQKIVEMYKGEKPHVIGVHRGSLPLAVKLSNIFNNGMSIVKFQTRSGSDKVPSMILNEIPNHGPILVVDDIVDSGYTFDMIHDLICDGENCNDVMFLAIHDNNTIKKRLSFPVYALRETHGAWIEYSWE